VLKTIFEMICTLEFEPCLTYTSPVGQLDPTCSRLAEAMADLPCFPLAWLGILSISKASAQQHSKHVRK
jgi:hypothetical protein